MDRFDLSREALFLWITRLSTALSRAEKAFLRRLDVGSLRNEETASLVCDFLRSFAFLFLFDCLSAFLADLIIGIVVLG